MKLRRPYSLTRERRTIDAKDDSTGNGTFGSPYLSDPGLWERRWDSLSADVHCDLRFPIELGARLPSGA